MLSVDWMHWHKLPTKQWGRTGGSGLGISLYCYVSTQCPSQRASRDAAKRIQCVNYTVSRPTSAGCFQATEKCFRMEVLCSLLLAGFRPVLLSLLPLNQKALTLCALSPALRHFEPTMCLNEELWNTWKTLQLVCFKCIDRWIKPREILLGHLTGFPFIFAVCI